jgi:hypothetical protein
MDSVEVGGRNGAVCGQSEDDVPGGESGHQNIWRCCPS